MKSCPPTVIVNALLVWSLATGMPAAAPTPAPVPLGPVPSPQQLAWQRLEMTMFFHFGVNTFTDREWGDGKEDPAIFQPAKLDCAQWARTAREAGFGLGILTAKHHDGFCLWPSQYTRHSVASSPWRDGKGDVVREFTDAFRAAGLAVGLYLSPWDRNQPVYGDSPKYNTYFENQLAELMTGYGTIDEIWFDGACGEGPNGKRQEYDWPAYYKTVYDRNPAAVIAICGPDVRWVGNESGVARPGESSVQNAQAGRHGAVKGKAWYPAECDVSIRPGWFYHKSQDDKVKPLDHLLDIYFKSVGRNSVLLLNVPPNRDGLIAPPDVARLREFKAALDAMYANEATKGAHCDASSVRGHDAAFGAAKARDGDLDTYWATDDGITTGWLAARFDEPRTFNVIDVREALRLGERVRRYHVEVRRGDAWVSVAGGTIIGSRNLLRIAPERTDGVRLVIDEAAACPAIAHFAAYFREGLGSTASGSVCAHKPAVASNVHGAGTVYGGDKAVDDDMATRWATSDETRACTLDVDLQSEQRFGRVFISELEPRITRFTVEYRDKPDEPWKVAYEGKRAGKRFAATFEPVKARYARLNILDATFAPTIWEFQLLPPETR